jgi:hypothetical protein
MYFADGLTLDKPRRTADGYMAVRARAARAGVYQYAGSEVDPNNEHGLRDQAVVNVLRDEAAVFDERAVRSFIGKPITNDHPREAVNATNWKKYADGVVMGAIRDGDHLAFDLLLMDAAAIADTEAGKVQLSNGYDASLQFGDYAAADGTRCQARQDAISGNHVARVDLGRAGPSCRIGDAAHCDAAPQSFLDSLHTQEKPVKTMLIDGLTVDISNADTAQATIATILAARDGFKVKIGDLETQVATLTTDKATADAKITTLEQQLIDSKPTPAQLRDAAKAYAQTAGKAKVLGITVTDAMDETAIMKAVVDKKLGDKAQGWNDAQYAASFASLTADVKVEAVDALASAITGQPVSLGDARSEYLDARAKSRNELSQAWKTAPKTAEA